MTIVEAGRAVTGGVDTHADVHVAAALDPIGGLLGVESFAATTAGYAQLTEWMGEFGPVAKVGVEGTGAYGSGLARFLRGAGIEVIEVDRSNRQARRQHGKSDPADALEAARAAQGGRAQGIAKSRDGTVEAIRALTVARRSAQHTRIATLNQMRQLCITAPDEIRDRFRGLSAGAFAKETAALRPRPSQDRVIFATYTTLQALGRRVRYLEEELGRVDDLLGELVAPYAPALMALKGVGVQTAAILVVAAGDNPERIRTEAAWAHLCGVSPIEASSGKVTRHRLDRAGNRQANKALWTIVMVRMAGDPRTRAYVERRTKEGRSKREIIRVLKRYVAREVYRHLPRH